MKLALYINSFCIATPFAHEIMLGFQEYLSANNVLAHHEYRELDVCGTPNLIIAPEKVKNIQKLLDKEAFDLIVTNGNEAAHLFTEGKLKTGNTHTQLIMVNLYDNIMQTNQSGIPTTGVIAIYRPYALMDMAVKLKPDTKKIVILAGAMDDAREYLKRLKINRKSAPGVSLEIISGQYCSYGEMVQRLEAQPPDTVLIFHSWNSIKDSKRDGGSFIEDLSHKFKGIILSGKESYMRRGASGGLLISGREFGQQAGKLAIRIFNGESASSIPFTNITPRKTLSYDAIEKYGIAKENIPQDMILLNAPDNILRNHWKEALAILAGILLILQLFIMKLYYYRRMTNQLKKSEVRYQNNEKMLNTIMDNLPGMLFVKNIDDNFRYIAANSSFLEMVRCTREQTVGHFDDDLFSHTPEMAEKFKKDDAAIVANGKSLDIVETVFNGSKNYTLRTIKTIVHQENGPRLLIGMSVDMSKQVKLEKEREDMIKNLNQLITWEQLTNYVLMQTIQNTDFDTIVADNMRRISDTVKIERVYIFRYTGENRSMAALEYSWERTSGIMRRKYDNISLNLHDHKDTRTALAKEGECFYTADPYPDGRWAAEQKNMKQYPELYARQLAEITIEGKPYGFIGMDYDRQNHPQGGSKTFIRNMAQIYQLAFERHLKIRQLDEQRKFVKELIENIDIPLTLCDEEYNLIMINEKARKNAGPGFDEKWRSRKPGELIKCYDASSCCVKKGVPPDFCPVKHCLASGKSCGINHEWNGRHMFSTGQILYDKTVNQRYVLVADMDMTERVEHEKELKKALEAAQQAERAKSMFLATMSHEIRTPLNAIIGFSDILNSTELPQSEQQAHIRAIRFAGNALLSLINDILDLSKLEAEQMVLVMQKCNFAEQLHGISAIFQEKLRAKGLTYREIIPADMPVVEVDIMRIRQILLNLIGNAVKFSDQGSITAIVEFKPDNDENGTLRVKVQDSGCGIREDFRDKIFQPFGQQDAIRDSHVYNGTGLGLPISLRLAGRMGGKLYLESTGDSGSVFVLELPGVRYYRHVTMPTDSAEEKKITAPPSGKKILIVDDVPLNLKVLGTMLKKLGMTPVEAGSGAAALELIRLGCQPDMVLTDMWMPGMNGTELAWKIHQLPDYADTPIVVLTADVEVSQSFPMEHFSDMLIKPLTLEKLRQILG